MNWQRTWAITLRHLYNFKHSLDRLADGVYWPAIDIIIWGLTSQYIQNSTQQLPHIALILLTALIFWQTVWRTQHDVTISLLDELWNKNLLNLFSSPVTLKEWLAGIFFLGVVKMIGTIVFAILLTWVLYTINIISFGWTLIPFFANLIIVGWWIGLITSGFIFLHGTRIQTIAWGSTALLLPFSAVYYPVSSLPNWAQTIAKALPTSYMFEGMREIVAQNQFPMAKLLISFSLNIVYFILALYFLRFCFNKSKEKGFARLE
ncbi:ABC transporter permease [Patescibacteria group bacterium]|nr:ABC transporter permease [Patescibacteria group bacterium]MBU1931470.1 ABC transporter permease [Patescibacteria group bacterium]